MQMQFSGEVSKAVPPHIDKTEQDHTLDITPEHILSFCVQQQSLALWMLQSLTTRSETVEVPRFCLPTLS